MKDPWPQDVPVLEPDDMCIEMLMVDTGHQADYSGCQERNRIWVTTHPANTEGAISMRSYVFYAACIAAALTGGCETFTPDRLVPNSMSYTMEMRTDDKGGDGDGTVVDAHFVGFSWDLK